MSMAVVVGNPKPASRTFNAAVRIATRLYGRSPEVVVDLVDLGAALISVEDEALVDAVNAVRAADAMVVASPTYKASFTGILKIFLDRFPSGALAGKIALPVTLGGAWQHALAPEVFLKPVLVESGAQCPVRGLYLLDSDYEDPPGLDAWIASARRYVSWNSPSPRG
jgi:FMN reductase